MGNGSWFRCSRQYFQYYSDCCRDGVRVERFEFGLIGKMTVRKMTENVISAAILLGVKVELAKRSKVIRWRDFGLRRLGDEQVVL